MEKKQLTNQEVIDNFMKTIPPEVDRFVDICWEISDDIENYMNTHNLSKRKMCKLLKISRGKLSSYMCGMYNFSLKELSSIECKLNINLFKYQFAED